MPRTNRVRVWGWSLAVLVIAVGMPILSSAQPEISRTGFPTRAVGSGRWESSQDFSGKRDWQIEIERFGDDSIAGSIVVVGSPYLRKARVEGRVDGSEVYGVLVGDNNRQVGTFTGTVADTGLSGTYTTNEGDSGSWSWAGPAAARSLKSDRAVASEVAD